MIEKNHSEQHLSNLHLVVYVRINQKQRPLPLSQMAKIKQTQQKIIRENKRLAQSQRRAKQAIQQLIQSLVTIVDMKSSKKPSQFLQILLDSIAILFNLRLVPITIVSEVRISKELTISFWKSSFQQSGKYLCGPQFDFLKNLKQFRMEDLNGETLQLMEPLIVGGQKWFNQYYASKTSKSTKAICKWVYAAFEYGNAALLIHELLASQNKDLTLKADLTELALEGSPNQQVFQKANKIE